MKKSPFQYRIITYYPMRMFVTSSRADLIVWSKDQAEFLADKDRKQGFRSYVKRELKDGTKFLCTKTNSSIVDFTPYKRVILK